MFFICGGEKEDHREREFFWVVTAPSYLFPLLEEQKSHILSHLQQIPAVKKDSTRFFSIESNQNKCYSAWLQVHYFK
ncbi:hypothetical protein L6452_04670 [Arctium lappa]|uniref:Uncharacterized protein n=1 Tax=Arctium lappa TaxID=4217 RepID=A0ACB9EFB5_ARCLA|nr:hypothetical protein L6452_04670 [Arctium lappa]